MQSGSCKHKKHSDDYPLELRINRFIQDRFDRSPSTRGKFNKVPLGPAWFRGLSEAQSVAANDLNDCLRDDMEQRTTYRVSRLLDRLGVHPRPSRKNLRMLMRMSRGNDLAFLWFLMEMCYKTKSHGRSYDMNEQILMSAIFWLDLNPTLRELDRVLPLPHGSPAERAKLESKERRRENYEKLKEQMLYDDDVKKSVKPRPLAPYFEQPIIPRPFKTKRSPFAEYPERPALLRPVPEETAPSTFWTRWFGEYEFNEGHRVATSVLYTEVNNIFESMKAANISGDKVEVMCAQHQYISEMEKSLRMELELIKRNEIQDLITGRSRADERHRKRVLEELERMTACFQAQFHDLAAKTRIASTRKHLLTGKEPNIICLPNRSDELPGSDDEDAQKLGVRFIPSDKKPVCSDKDKWKGNSKKLNVKVLEGVNPLVPNCPDYVPEKMECGDCNLYDPKKGLPESDYEKPRPSSVKQFLQLCHELKTDKKKEQSPAQLPSCSNSLTYFKLGSLGATKFKFNYRRLFKQPHLSRLDDEQLRLTTAFVEALDDDCQYLNAVLNCEVDGSLDTLVKRAAKRIFQKDTGMFTQEYDRLVQRKAKKKHIVVDRLDFGQEFYDPADKNLMKHMLRQGLNKVAENRHYVLPTLPEVESVPYLLEWIYFRYGRRYTKEELRQSYGLATVFMERLGLLMKRRLVRPPPPCFTNYDLPELYSPELKRYANNISQRYRHDFVTSVMQVGRVFHSAMRPELCGNQISESTFYAYMPAKYHDAGFSISNLDRIKPPLKHTTIWRG